MSDAPFQKETRDKVIEGSTLSVGVIMALALYLMVNYLAARHFERFDWTAGHLYSLSEKSRAVVAGLDQDIDLINVLPPDSELYTAVEELLSGYEAANNEHVKKRVLDPTRDYLEYQRLIAKHDIRRDNVVVVASATDRRVVDAGQLAEYDYSGAQYGQGPTMEEFKGEQEITSAILELTEAEKPEILFVTGHGEAPLTPDTRGLSTAQIILGKDNFEIGTWSAPGRTEIPPETDLVVIAGPESAFEEGELELYSHYLEAGGRMLVLLDPVLLGSGEEGTRIVDLGLKDWLARYGVEIAQDLVIDPGNAMAFLGPEAIVTNRYGSHPIVEALNPRIGVHMTLARSVRPADPPPAGTTIDELIKTSDSGWGETRLDADLAFDESEDIAGPVSLGVAVSFDARTPAGTSEDTADTSSAVETVDETAADEAGGETGEAAAGDDEVPAFEPGEEGEPEEEVPDVPKARLVVLGDFDFASDAGIESAENRQLLLNTFNWLVQREQLITIEGRKPTETRLMMTSGEYWTVVGMVLLLLPGLAVALGISVFFRRRR